MKFIGKEDRKQVMKLFYDDDLKIEYVQKKIDEKEKALRPKLL